MILLQSFQNSPSFALLSINKTLRNNYKKLLFISLTLISCLILSACNEAKLDPKYEALINAIENGDYADARQELDKLMSNNGNNDNNQETECTHNYVENYRNEPRCTSDGEIGYSCSKCRHSYTEKIVSLGHDFSDPTCTERARCKRCNTSGDDKLGHAFEKGYCTRCNADDPEMLAMYNYAIKEVGSYALHGYASTYRDHDYVNGNPGGKYLYKFLKASETIRIARIIRQGSQL